MPTLHAVSPPGWSDTVERMKEHPEISNPFALSWWLYDQGDEPHKCEGVACKSCNAALDKCRASGALDVYGRRYGAMQGLEQFTHMEGATARILRDVHSAADFEALTDSQKLAVFYATADAGETSL